MQPRRSILAGLLSLGGLNAAAKVASAAEQPEQVYQGGIALFFAQRDTVIAFNGNTGAGTQVGTVEGSITGTSITNFQFIPQSQTTIKFDNRALITDTDGDQVLFRVVGTGRFITPLADTSNPLGSLMSLGGPLVATYITLQGSGKYAFLVGRQFPCKMAATNSVIGSNGVLGNVYAEIYSDSVGVLATQIKKNVR